MRTVRRMRHWKQRFAPDAAFVWNKPVTWEGKQVEIGASIPDSLANDRNRLRRFWEARVIQLADFTAPDVATGQSPEKQEPDVVPAGHPVHPEPEGEALESRTDEDVDETFETENGEPEVDPALGDEDPDEDHDDKDPDYADAEGSDEPVVKVADRKWAVVGNEDVTYPTKKAALEAAEASEEGEDPLES